MNFCESIPPDQPTNTYLRRSAINERGNSANIMTITAVLTGEKVHYKAKT